MRKLGVAGVLPLVFSAMALLSCNVRTDPSTSTIKEGPADAATVRAILEDKCYACHGDDSIGWGGMTYVTDLEALVANGKVVRGTPEQQQTSPLLLRVMSADKPMPPVVKPLEEADKKAINDWILADSPLTDEAGAEHPLATAAKASMQKNCASCHAADAPGQGEGGVNYITDLAQLIAKNKVKRGDETARKKSRVYLRVNNANNPMPPIVKPLEPSEIETIRGWVSSNAPAN